MTGINDFACEGTLTIGGISMNRLAWAVMGDERGRNGLLNLLTVVDQRGEDRTLSASIIPYQRQLNITRHQLRVLVVGDVDETGAATGDPLIGLVANLNYLYTNVIAPTGATDGTRAATIDLPGLAQRSADIHVLGLNPTQYLLLDQRPVWEGNLTISIPDGRFT